MKLHLLPALALVACASRPTEPPQALASVAVAAPPLPEADRLAPARSASPEPAPTAMPPMPAGHHHGH